VAAILPAFTAVTPAQPPSTETMITVVGSMFAIVSAV
jgi:hypothetical protein